jgi:molecular chaperone GrpE
LDKEVDLEATEKQEENPIEPQETCDETTCDETEKLRQDLKTANDLYLRALAEIENIRKRATREREEYIKFATLPLIKKLLNIIDDLERAVSMFDPQQDPETLVKGVEMINNRLKEIIKDEGVETVNALGEQFDPQYHQPLTIENNDEYEENTIIEELQKGYIMHGRLIRPSLVKVSK